LLETTSSGRNNVCYQTDNPKPESNGCIQSVRPDLIADDVHIVDEDATSSAAQRSDTHVSNRESPISSIENVSISVAVFLMLGQKRKENRGKVFGTPLSLRY